MNRERAKELLPIIQAFAEGKTIELKDSYEKWVESDLLAFDLSPKNYHFGTNNNCLDYEYMFKMYKFIDGTAFV